MSNGTSKFQKPQVLLVNISAEMALVISFVVESPDILSLSSSPIFGDFANLPQYSMASDYLFWIMQQPCSDKHHSRYCQVLGLFPTQ